MCWSTLTDYKSRKVPTTFCNLIKKVKDIWTALTKLCNKFHNWVNNDYKWLNDKIITSIMIRTDATIKCLGTWTYCISNNKFGCISKYITSFGSNVKVVVKYQFAWPKYLGTMLTLNRAYIYINHKQQPKPTSVSIWIHWVCEVVSHSTELCWACRPSQMWNITSFLHCSGNIIPL